MTLRPRGRRVLDRLRRSEAEGARTPASVGWDTPATGEPRDPATTEAVPLSAQILALLSDPRVDGVTAVTAAQALGMPRADVETTLEALAQAGRLLASEGTPRRYGVPPIEKQRLEQLFRNTARELGEQGVLVRTLPNDAMIMVEDPGDEPRLPVTAGLLSLFLPGTGQLLNGDVGRASLVFAVWSLAWITHLSPVWTFVCLYAGAEAFFTAKIRSLERRLAQETAVRGVGGGPPARALPPKPSTG